MEMTEAMQWVWAELGIPPSDDPREIRRAYARRLKAIDPDRDRDAFQRLRRAFETALAPHAKRRQIPERATAQPIAAAALVQPPPSPEAAAPSADEAEAQALAGSIRRTLAEGALEEAFALLLRAAARAVLSLAEERALYVRLMALAVRRPDLPAERFRAMARHGGWDSVTGAVAAGESGLRQQVQRRLEADGWYADLQLATRRFGRPRHIERSLGRNTWLWARLFLGRAPRWIGYFLVTKPAPRRWMRQQLAAYERHRPWLDDRLAAHLAWIGEMFPPQGRRAPAWFVILWIAVLFALVFGLPLLVGWLAA
jgi:hypothetical protein